MTAYYPRPDAETNAHARHLWAYYDGVNSVTYEIPVGVAFGAPPYRYQLVSAPAGSSIGRFYGDPNYGIMTLAPQGTLTNAPVVCRVIDQEGTVVDLTWTITTSSSPSRFQFVGGVGANDANDGSFGSRKATLQGVWGLDSTVSTFPAANVYMDGGAYSLPTTASPGYGINLSATLKPSALMGLPGATVTIDSTNGNVQTDYDDTFIGNITFDGYDVTRDNYRLIRTGACERNTYYKVRWINSGQGVVGDDNATMFWFPNEGTYYQYVYIKACEEYDRPSGGANNYGLCSVYQREYVLIEDCIVRGSPYVGLYVKATNRNVCLRYNDIQIDEGYALSLGFISDGPAYNVEVCYNKVRTPNEFIAFPHEGGVGAANVFIKRNTLYDTRIYIESPNLQGPYEVDSNAIMSSGTLVSSGSQVTTTNTECHGNMASGIINPTTLLLEAAFAANRGQRGHEIWKP